MMSTETTVKFIDDFVEANMPYLSNHAFGSLEFLSLWLQSHPNISQMTSKDRSNLAHLLQELANSPIYTQETRATWHQICESLFHEETKTPAKRII